MKKKTAASFTLCLALSLQARAAQPAYMAPFIKDMNRILEIRDQTVAPSLDEMRTMTALGCNAIKTLENDKQFHIDMAAVSKMSAATKERRGLLAQNLVNFTGGFLPAEKRLLVDAGVQPETAERLIWSAAALRNTVDGTFDAEAVLQNIGTLGAELCNAAAALQAAQNQRDASAMYRRWTFRIGGVVFIVADVATVVGTAPASAGTSAFLASGSVAIGTAIVTWGQEAKK